MASQKSGTEPLGQHLTSVAHQQVPPAVLWSGADPLQIGGHQQARQRDQGA